MEEEATGLEVGDGVKNEELLYQFTPPPYFKWQKPSGPETPVYTGDSGAGALETLVLLDQKLQDRCLGTYMRDR